MFVVIYVRMPNITHKTSQQNTGTEPIH